MPPITRLTEEIFLTGALVSADFKKLGARGFRSVINLRPDHEAPNQITAAEARQAAHAAGLLYVHVPSTKHDLLTDPVVEAASAAFKSLPRPVIAHCASGQRAAIIWAAAAARSEPVSSVLATLSSAGYDLGFLRDDLEAQADRARWATSVATASDARSECEFLAGAA